MTRQCNDPEHSTKFSLWTRRQAELDSGRPYCFNTTNIDFLWENYNTEDWMFVEEKRCYGDNFINRLNWYFSFENKKTYGQRSLFHKLDRRCKPLSDYRGFWMLWFENEAPDDGASYLFNYLGKNNRPADYLIHTLDEQGVIDFLSFRRMNEFQRRSSTQKLTLVG